MARICEDWESGHATAVCLEETPSLQDPSLRQTYETLFGIRENLSLSNGNRRPQKRARTITNPNDDSSHPRSGIVAEIYGSLGMEAGNDIGDLSQTAG